MYTLYIVCSSDTEEVVCIHYTLYVAVTLRGWCIPRGMYTIVLVWDLTCV